MGEYRYSDDFDLTVDEIVLIHKTSFGYAVGTAVYRDGRGIDGLVHCLSGEAVFDFGGTTFALSEGETVYLPAGCAYTVMCRADVPFEHITANFTVRRGQIQTDTVPGAILSGTILPVKVPPDSALADTLSCLLSVWTKKTFGYRVSARATLYEAIRLYFSDAVRHLCGDRDYYRLLPAKKLLDEDYTEDISVPALAAACRLSETHFRRQFARFFGCSPVKYRLNRRVLHAKDLLLAGDMSVAEVSERVGFEDSNYFGRVFRHLTGMTPREYAKRG